MSQAVEEIRARLFSLQDTEYKAFQSRLMPTVSPEAVIGVRMPQLRRLARELTATPEATAFMAD